LGPGRCRQERTSEKGLLRLSTRILNGRQQRRLSRRRKDKRKKERAAEICFNCLTNVERRKGSSNLPRWLRQVKEEARRKRGKHQKELQSF